MGNGTVNTCQHNFNALSVELFKCSCLFEETSEQILMLLLLGRFSGEHCKIILDSPDTCGVKHEHVE